MPNSVILIVDDNDMLRSTIVTSFQRQAFEVMEASSGYEALQIVRNHFDIIDAVLTDVRMPNGTGIELLDDLHRDNPHKPLVFVMTGFADMSEEEVLAKGATAYFVKPFSMKDVIAKIQQALASNSPAK